MQNGWPRSFKNLLPFKTSKSAATGTPKVHIAFFFFFFKWIWFVISKGCLPSCFVMGYTFMYCVCFCLVTCFVLFVSLKEVHHGVYTTTYFEEHKGKFSELPKQSTEKGLHATPSYSQVQVPSIQLLCLKN